jgi:repressor LexA
MDGKAPGRGRRPVETLTEPQRRTFGVVQEFMRCHGFPPTIQDLAELLGISTASAHQQISHLIRKGYISRQGRKARGLSIIRQPQNEVAALTPVPLLGTVPAGPALLAEENKVGEVLVDESIARRGPCFALTVSGDSMIKAGIHDGDVVIVRQQPLAQSGEIVVALVDGEATVKRLCIQGDRIELRPENPKHRPIHIDPEGQLRILGKVVAVRRGGDDPDG